MIIPQMTSGGMDGNVRSFGSIELVSQHETM